MTAFNLLYQEFALTADNSGKYLWLLTESLSDSENTLLNRTDTQVLTNRWDIAQQYGPSAVFNDFELQGLPEFDGIFLYIPKEKAVLNHLLNQCAEHLTHQGKVFIAGEKNQGIKSIGKNCKGVFNQNNTAKHGEQYLVTLSSPAAPAQRKLLNCQNYRRLQPIGEHNPFQVYSKPGVFGWNKFDAGSVLLAQHLAQVAVEIKPNTASVLDLGCGYGYLTLAAAALGFSQLHATDNNAGAIVAITESAKANNLAINIWPDDSGASCQDKFDLILCNPPFHQGFDHSQSLSAKFVRNIARLKSANGRALVVVNQFINLPELAARYFDSTTLVAGNKSFRVYELK